MELEEQFSLLTGETPGNCLNLIYWDINLVVSNSLESLVALFLAPLLEFLNVAMQLEIDTILPSTMCMIIIHCSNNEW